MVTYALPETDGVPGKPRPCVVVSCETHNRTARDLVLVPVTTSPYQERIPNSAVLRDWLAAGLRKPSLVKPVFFTVQLDDVGEPIGELSAADKVAVKVAIASVMGFNVKKPAGAA